MSKITLDAWVRRGWAAGYLHPEARLIVVRADPAETERLRALHADSPRAAHPPPLAGESGSQHQLRYGRKPRR